MISLLRCSSDHPGFVHLVSLLDADLLARYGQAQEFYSQFNTLVKIRHVVLGMEGEQAVACGAMRELEPGIMEIKRMFTLPEKRGQGLAGQVLEELEAWAKELGYGKCVLETGIHQPEAIHLYEKKGYSLIPNYGQYMEVDTSVCYEKML